MKYLGSLFVVLACTLAGCGSAENKGNGPSPVDSARNNSLGGRCGSVVVSNYNTAVGNCSVLNAAIASNTSVALQDCTPCKLSWQSLLDKYPGISCAAVQSDKTSVNDKGKQVEATDIKKLIDGLTQSGC